MGILTATKIKIVTRKQLSDIAQLQQQTSSLPTPASDAALRTYLVDSLAWLDSFDE